MSLPKVDIQIQTGALGRFTDVGGGKAGIVVLMAAADEPVGHVFGEVKPYSHLIDMPLKLQAVKALQLYFSLADGASAYILPVVDTTTIANVVALAHASHFAEKLIEASNEIKFIGVIGTQLLATLPTAITNAQALGASYVSKMRPVITILPYSFITADVVPSQATASNDRVGVVISYAGDEVGLVIGKLASLPVQRNIGRVKDGALPISAAILDGAANPKKDVAQNMSVVETLHGKSYITIRTIVGKSGYYFTDDLLANTPGDFSNIANRRVIDKAMVICYNTYVEEINNEVQLTANGKMNPGVIKALQGSIENSINNQMTANNEISSVTAFVDETQNVLSTQKIEVVVKIIPVGYSKEIVVKLGFSNPVTA